VKTFVRIDCSLVSLVAGPEADFSDEVVRNMRRLADNIYMQLSFLNYFNWHFTFNFATIYMTSIAKKGSLSEQFF